MTFLRFISNRYMDVWLSPAYFLSLYLISFRSHSVVFSNAVGVYASPNTAASDYTLHLHHRPQVSTLITEIMHMFLTS